MTDWIDDARLLRGETLKTPLDVLTSIIQKQAAEIERLRAALNKISKDGGCLGHCWVIARKALGEDQT